MRVDEKLALFVETHTKLDLSMLDRARKASRASNQSLQSSLIALGFVTEARMAQLISDCFDIPLLTKLSQFEIEPGLEEEFETQFLHRRKIVPLARNEREMSVVLADPLNIDLVHMLEFHTDKSIKRVIAEPSLIEAALGRYYPLEETNLSEELSQQIQTDDAEKLRQLANEGPVVKFIHSTITNAVDVNASDIHFETRESGVVVRYRIHGLLQTIHTETSLDSSAIFSRLKVLADLNISERRKPQDGRFQFAIRGRDIDFRVSTLPTQFGESIVLRVLDRNALTLEFQGLGFSPELEENIKTILDQPNGLFLITGPTGSGKTTTLYAALNYLNRSGVKLCSVEDPIEYSIEGVNQVQVHAEIGLTFATALRALLRQDPNIIMIGEIRDAETAEIACRAALIGRLVLSTLHVNSAEEAVTRLRDLGVEDYLVNSVLRGVLAQVLVPKRCVDCVGSGCETCGGSGVIGQEVEARLLDSRHSW